MLQFDEYKVKLNNLAPALEELGQALDLEAAERELDMLEAESASDGFWDKLDKAQKVQQRIKVLQDKVDSQAKRQSQWDDLMALCEMGNEFEDESLVPELEEGYAKLEQDAYVALGFADTDAEWLEEHPYIMSRPQITPITEGGFGLTVTYNLEIDFFVLGEDYGKITVPITLTSKYTEK